MAEQAANPAPIKSSDRLSFTIFVAVVVHLVIILGIAFKFEINEPSKLTDMEVIFIENSLKSENSEADYLAQVSQQGGGNVEEKVRPTSPPPSEMPSQNPDIAPAPQMEMVAASEPKPVQEQLATELQAPAELKQLQSPEPEVKQGLTAQQLIKRSREIAELVAELDEQSLSYSKLPRKKIITASTREYVAAAYMASWQQKVEHIGTLHYNETSGNQRVYGSLVLEVNIRPDGSVQDINILKSSGKPVLDQAAMRIVRLSAPFAPFPDELMQEMKRENNNVIAIIRTWQFDRGGFATQ